MSRCGCCHTEARVADFRHLGIGMLCMPCFTRTIMSGECVHAETEELPAEEYLQLIRDAGEEQPQERDELKATFASITDAMKEQHEYMKGFLDDGWEPWILYAWVLESVQQEDLETVRGIATAGLVCGAVELQVREALDNTEEP